MRWPLAIRRALAAVLIVLLVIVALLIAAAERIDFARSAELVRTEEQRVGVLAEVNYRGRFRTDYIIRVDGHERTLDYGEFITNEAIGSSVNFVVDPEDETRLIAVGTPEDWNEKPVGIGLTLALIAIALILGGLAASRIIPEDLGGIRSRTSKAQRRRNFPER